MKTLEMDIVKYAGAFAEDKDIARDLRKKVLEPALTRDATVVVDFSGVQGATQSFVHALISKCIRESNGRVLERLTFKGCSGSVKRIVTIVVEYSQEGSVRTADE